MIARSFFVRCLNSKVAIVVAGPGCTDSLRNHFGSRAGPSPYLATERTPMDPPTINATIVHRPFIGWQKNSPSGDEGR